jgi:hypothetical protein
MQFLCFQQYFSYIMATSFSGGGSRITRREPPTLGKELVNFIIFGAPFFVYPILEHDTSLMSHDK